MTVYRDLRRMGWLAAAMLAWTPPVLAQQAEPQCPRDTQPIPAAFAGWSSRTALATAAQGEGPTVSIGKAYDLALRPDAELRLPNLPGPVEDRVGNGGIASLDIDRAGTYRVALGAGAWVDLVKDGKALESVGHGHGPACSGIRKIVDFALQPGRYLITLDGSEAASVPVLVARAP